MDRVLAAGAAALREVDADRIRAAWKRTLATLAMATAVTLVRVLGGCQSLSHAPHVSLYSIESCCIVCACYERAVCGMGACLCV